MLPAAEPYQDQLYQQNMQKDDLLVKCENSGQHIGLVQDISLVLTPPAYH